MDGRRVRWLLGLATLLIVAYAFEVRIRTRDAVFRDDGAVELVPTDSYYYVRFAQLQLRSLPEFTAFDPYVNPPDGARIIWPPVHTGFVAAAVAIAPSGAEERAAAWVGPVLSVLWLLVIALAAWRTLGPARAALLALVLAVFPAAIESGAVGNADHHVHEPYLAALAALWMGQALAAPSRGYAIAAGVLLGAARGLTTTSFVIAGCIAVGAALAAIFERDAARRAAAARACLWTGGVAAGVSAALVLLFGELGSPRYEALSFFHPLFLATAFLAASAVLAFSARERRLGALAAFAALAAVAPLLATMWEAVGHLGRTDPLLAVVVESAPLYRYPRFIVPLFGGLVLLVPIAIAAGAIASWRERTSVVAPALGATVSLAIAAVLQLRFSQPFVGAFAVTFAAAYPALSARLSAPLRYALLAVVALAFISLPFARQTRDPAAVTDEALIRPTLQWIRANTPPASPDPLSPEQPSYGVVAPHDLGHLILLWAQRPAVATPFSQAPAHVEGNRRAAAVLAAADDEEAFRRALETRGRYLLVAPSPTILGRPELDPEKSFGGWLLRTGGLEGVATGHFKLIHESAERAGSAPDRPHARVFEVVPGAIIEGVGAPASEVEVSVELQTRAGARHIYRRYAHPSRGEKFRIPVAYGSEGDDSGFLSAVEGARYRVRSGTLEGTVDVSEDAVRSGQTVPVILRPSLSFEDDESDEDEDEDEDAADDE